MNDIRPETPDGNAELYALGALLPREIEEFEESLQNGTASRDDVDEHLQTVVALAEQLASVMPAPRRAVKDAIMAAIAPEDTSAQTHAAAEGREQIFVMQSDGQWQEVMPGIHFKSLWNDTETGQFTFLARLEPGAHYPSHRHAGVEECLVIEGDLRMNDHVLLAGEYTVAFADNVHHETRSEGGCLLMLRSPMNDEFLGE